MARPERDTYDDPPSFRLLPILPLQHVQFVKLYDIENCCTILGNYSLLFVTKITANITLIFKFEFFLLSSPISLCLLSTPQKNIKVDPIIRIILVPPLSSVKLSRAVFRGMGGMSPLNQKPIPLEPQNEMTLSTGVYGEPPV